MNPTIRITGARQNNLKNLDLTLNTGDLTVITGVSGSGKSSLAFDTLYAEGQRRYVETFSPYARQFLDRMDKPVVDRIEGILPAIAIDQTNPVRSSRSTVGTMTELNDHLKLLFARGAKLVCRGCGQTVCRDGLVVTVDKVAAGMARERDRRGRSLPVWQGCRVVADDALFLMNSRSTDSLDGRYFGPLPRSAVTGRAHPVWTKEE